MARRRRKRKNNPDPYLWAIVGLGAVVLGGGGYAAYRVLSARKRRQSLPPPPTRMPEGSVGPGGCGAAYPGFVFDGQGCVPTENTPGGIYVAEGCTDFVFAEGDVGPQIDYLESLVEAGVSSSMDPNAPSVDPTSLATAYFDEFWGECPWPPPAGSSDRIVHLYSAVSYLLGALILADGGRVLGTSDPETAAEQLATRLNELGLPDFDPDIVPEIEIPQPGATGFGGGPSQVGAPDMALPEGSQWYVESHQGLDFTVAIEATPAAQWGVGGNNYNWYVWNTYQSPKTPDTARAGSQAASIEAAQQAAATWISNLESAQASL